MLKSPKRREEATSNHGAHNKFKNGVGEVVQVEVGADDVIKYCRRNLTA